jgi:hypothetical protein
VYEITQKECFEMKKASKALLVLGLLAGLSFGGVVVNDNGNKSVAASIIETQSISDPGGGQGH